MKKWAGSNIGIMAWHKMLDFSWWVVLFFDLNIIEKLFNAQGPFVHGGKQWLLFVF